MPPVYNPFSEISARDVKKIQACMSIWSLLWLIQEESRQREVRALATSILVEMSQGQVEAVEEFFDRLAAGIISLDRSP